MRSNRSDRFWHHFPFRLAVHHCCSFHHCLSTAIHEGLHQPVDRLAAGDDHHRQIGARVIFRRDADGKRLVKDCRRVAGRERIVRGRFASGRLHTPSPATGIGHFWTESDTFHAFSTSCGCAPIIVRRGNLERSKRSDTARIAPPLDVDAVVHDEV